MQSRLPLLAALSAFLVSAPACHDGAAEPTIWEYKVVSVYSEGPDRIGEDAFSFSSVTPSEFQLDLLGLEGWELVTGYLEMETAFPNFGNEGYVTGIQPNVRPQRVVLIFKRPKPDEEEG